MTTYSLALLIYGITMPLGLLVLAILCGANDKPIMSMTMRIIYGPSLMDEFNVLLGVASFFKGFMKMTFFLCIFFLLLEITNNLSLLPQVIMLVLSVLKIVGNGFNDVVYKLHVQIKEIPFLEELPLSFMQHLIAHDAIMGPLVWF
jgi:chloride channel 7